MSQLPKIVVVLGPTASGKTDLSIQLAKAFNGEIISVDSRQIYKKMQVATVKPKGEWKEITAGVNAYVVDSIPHYMMDIVDPGVELSVAEFKQQAVQHINGIIQRGKLPILAGGTGLYVWAIVDNLDIPNVPPNKKLRRSLEAKSPEELVALLRNLDPKAAETMDTKNIRRVIRALEVAILTGNTFSEQRKAKEPMYEVLQIGLSRSIDDLFARIDARIDDEMGMKLIDETQVLLKQKYGWNLPSMTGLGYRQIGAYLRGEQALPAALEEFKRETRDYARRQMTWFRRDKRIQWIPAGDVEMAKRMVEEFLNKRDSG